MLATGVLVAVVFASGAVRVQLGSAGIVGALLGSVALGVGYGAMLWTFGRLSGAQTNPLISVIASVVGGQPWPRTALRVGAQALGAGAVGLVVGRLAPKTFVADPDFIATTPSADAIASFGVPWPRDSSFARCERRRPLSCSCLAAVDELTLPETVHESRRRRDRPTPDAAN